MDPTPVEPKLFSLEILSKIKHAQMANGLRHGDYNRYRRIARIHKKIRVGPGGKHSKPNKVVTPAMVTDVRHLELVLMLSERAWAHSMSLKELPVDSQPRAKFHSASRLGKAAKWSTLLLDLCNHKADERTKLEAESYNAWFIGNIFLYKEDWKNALTQLIKARTVYSELGKVGTLEQQELCQERVNEIEPSIRYAEYNLGQKGGDTEAFIRIKSEADDSNSHGIDMLKSKLDNVLLEVRKKEAKAMREFTWRGQKIPIRNENLRLAIVSLNDLIFSLHEVTNEHKTQIYDKIFICLNDALNTIKSEAATLEASKNLNIKKQEELQNLSSLEEHLCFVKAEQVCNRNWLLTEDLESKVVLDERKAGKNSEGKSADVVRMYELLISDATTLGNLKEFDELEVRKYSAMELSFKALRCFYVAFSYQENAKFDEAAALYERCETQSRIALSHLEAIERVDQKLVTKVEAIKNKAAGFGALVHAKSLLPADTKSQEVATSQQDGGLLAQPDNFAAPFLSTPSGPKLIDFPPKFEPISCKPLLFDLALSECSFPDLTERKKAPKSGFFSSWFG